MSDFVFKASAGFEAILGFKMEPSSVSTPSMVDASAAVEAPLSAPSYYVGYAHVPEVRTERESKKGFGIGSPYAVFNAQGTRRYSVNTDMALTDYLFLQRCNPGSGGYKGLADFALFTGTSDNLGSGFTRVIRLAKCNTYTLDLKEGSAQDIRMQATFLGLLEQDVTTVTPTPAQLVASGSPYFWSTVMNVNVVNGSTTTTFRDVVSGINIQGNNNLKPRGFRSGTDETDPLNLCHYAICPGKFTGKATLTFHDKLPDAFRKSAATSSIWGDIVISMQHPTQKSMTITLQDCLLDPDYQNSGGDGDEPMAFGCEVQFSRLTVSGTNYSGFSSGA